MKNVLMFIWTLPQTLLGLLLLCYYRPTRLHKLEDGTMINYTSRISGGITLGRYVFVAATHYRVDINETLRRDTVRHNAIGHAKQSKVLGWLYIPLLILSRLMGLLLLRKKYSFGMERLADRIAKVNRHD